MYFIHCVLSTRWTKCSYGQDNGPMFHTVFNERKTIPSDRAMALMCSIKEDNLPLLWYLGKCKIYGGWIKVFSQIWLHPMESKDQKESTIKSVKCFCEIFHTLTFHTHTHTLRLVSPWGCPGNPAYPSGDMPLQPREATACSPGTLRGCPMARRLPLQSPQHTQCTLASGRAYPWYPAYTVFSKAPGAHTDYKTTRLQILPTTREHNKMPRGGKIQINSPEDGKYREKSPAEAIQRKT